MITEYGYSNDPSLRPEGIVITWGKDMIDEKGGLKNFIYQFESCWDEETLWLQKSRNQPKHDILYVYIIVANRLYYRLNYVGYEPCGPSRIIDNSWSSYKTICWPRIICSGPPIKCPFKRELRGFQGFRYCTYLF